MDMYDRIDKLLEENKISKRKLSLDLAIPYTTIASMFSRRSTSVDIETIKKIAHYLHADLDYIVSGVVYTDDTTIGERIKLYRFEMGMTQEKLAELTGYTIDEIIDIENDKLNLSTEEIMKFAEILCEDDPHKFIIDEHMENLPDYMPHGKNCVVIYFEDDTVSRKFMSKEHAEIIYDMAVKFNKMYLDEKNKKDNQ